MSKKELEDLTGGVTRAGDLVREYDKALSMDQRIDITERRFLEEIDQLESMKNHPGREDKLSVEIARLMLEFEKVQLKRRKEELETSVNWNHLQSVAQFFVKKLYDCFDQNSVDEAVERMLIESFMKTIESWETDVIREGILDAPGKQKSLPEE